LRSGPRAAVAFSTAAILLTGSVLAGCEYHYDDGWRPTGNGVSAAPAIPATASAEEQETGPLGGADMDAWLETVHLGSGLQVAHRGYGLLKAGEIRSKLTPGLPAGRYVLALACRSKGAVTFSVSNEAHALVQISLHCGPTRQNVIYLSQETVLTFRVEADSAANYAYRLIWL
jgi:hypothetical protein